MRATHGTRMERRCRRDGGRDGGRGRVARVARVARAARAARAARRLGGSAARPARPARPARQNNRSGSASNQNPSERSRTETNSTAHPSCVGTGPASAQTRIRIPIVMIGRASGSATHRAAAGERRERRYRAPLAAPIGSASPYRHTRSAHRRSKQIARPRPAGQQALPRPRPPDRRPRRARPYRGASRAGRTLRHVNPPTGTASATRARRRPHRSDGACAPRVRARAAPDRVCPHRRNGRSR
ncbi:hypothetical protein Y602_5923 [Burkholderia pseudomallei MSHR733]|nr:hypothetical protein Y602_5923 [Burkholderia pseudomallei MSHR733]